MGRHRTPAIASCCLALALPAGCGREEQARIPDACREGADAVRSALKAAPEAVRIDGTPLSACLVDGSDGGELRDVGAAFVETAAGLAAAAAVRPEGPAATQLGYLMGAVHRGASSAKGTNSELVRRLEQELLVLGRPSREFERGRRAGLQGG